MDLNKTMNWTNKFYDFKIKCLFELKRVIRKGYDQSGEDIYSLPTMLYTDDFTCDTYSLIRYDKEDQSFLGISWHSSDTMWFYFDDLNTQCICELIDLINESDKV